MPEKALYQDDLPTIRLSRRMVDAVQQGYVVKLGEVEQLVGVVRSSGANYHGGRDYGFPYFVCPQCRKKTRVLRLHERKLKCPQCVGLPWLRSLLTRARLNVEYWTGRVRELELKERAGALEGWLGKSHGRVSRLTSRSSKTPSPKPTATSRSRRRGSELDTGT